MILSLCGAGLNAGALTFLDYCKLAARHGFGAVDFGLGQAQKAADALDGPAALVHWMERHGVAFGPFGLDVEWRRDDDTFEAGMEGLVEKAAFAQKIGATRCVTWMPPSAAEDSGAWFERTAHRFSRIAAIFDDYGIRLGLEWVGPHHLRAGGANQMGPNPTVWDLPGTLLLIDTIGRDNVGLLVDSYHCYTADVSPDTLASLTDAQIVHVHINDAPTGATPETALDGGRVLPGEGVIDLAGFLDGLRRAGYAGTISCEVLAPRPIADDPETAAEKVRASLRNVGL